MSHSRIFKTLNNGEITIQLYNPNTDLDDVLHVLREGYMKYATSFIAFEMNKLGATQDRLEYEKLAHAVLNTGISVVARHVPTNRIIGFSLNNLQSCPKPGQSTFYEEIRDKCKSQLVRNLLNFRIAKDKQIDLFKMYNIKHYIEIVYLVTLPEYRVKNIAYHLAECTVILAREIVKAQYPVTMDEKMKGKIPEIVFGSASSKYSARIGEKLGFVVVKIFPHNKLKVDGVSLSEKVSPEHTESTLNVLKL